MTFEFQLTEDDFVEAQRAHMRKFYRNRKVLVFMVIIASD